MVQLSLLTAVGVALSSSVIAAVVPLLRPRCSQTEECKDFASLAGCERGARCSFKHTGQLQPLSLRCISAKLFCCELISAPTGSVFSAPPWLID